jgi:phosphotransferase system HPr-like phosphotransfer protein
MHYRARVTLQCDPYGIHLRPAAWAAEQLEDLDAVVQFHRDGRSVDIRPEVAMVDIMQAATDLRLDCGCTFEITCGGAQAREAFRALRAGFTTNYFEGSDFTPLQSPTEAEDG